MSPTSYQAAPPRDRGRILTWSAVFSTSETDCAQSGGEAFCVLKSDHPCAVNLAPLRVEEDRAGRAEQAKTLEQRAVVVVVGGDVGFQQQCARHLVGHRRVAEREALHLLARDAPVGIEIEH